MEESKCVYENEREEGEGERGRERVLIPMESPNH